MGVSVVVERGPTIPVAWTAGMNAQDAIEAAQEAAGEAEFTFALQYYGKALGYLVLMINETYDSFVSSGAPFYFWEFLVDGTPSPTGIDSTQVADGAVLTFRFTSYNAMEHSSTPLGVKHRMRTANS